MTLLLENPRRRRRARRSKRRTTRRRRARRSNPSPAPARRRSRRRRSSSRRRGGRRRNPFSTGGRGIVGSLVSTAKDAAMVVLGMEGASFIQRVIAPRLPPAMRSGAIGQYGIPLAIAALAPLVLRKVPGLSKLAKPVALGAIATAARGFLLMNNLTGSNLAVRFGLGDYALADYGMLGLGDDSNIELLGLGDYMMPGAEYTGLPAYAS